MFVFPKRVSMDGTGTVDVHEDVSMCVKCVLIQTPIRFLWHHARNDVLFSQQKGDGFGTQKPSSVSV